MTKRTKGVVFAVAVVCLGLQLMAQTSRHVVVHAGHLLDVKSGKVLHHRCRRRGWKGDWPNPSAAYPRLDQG